MLLLAQGVQEFNVWNDGVSSTGQDAHVQSYASLNPRIYASLSPRRLDNLKHDESANHSPATCLAGPLGKQDQFSGHKALAVQMAMHASGCAQHLLTDKPMST